MMALKDLFAFTLAILMSYYCRLCPVFYFMLPSPQTFAACGKPAGVSLSLSPLIISSLGPLILQQPFIFLMCPLFSLIYSNCHAWDSLVCPLPPLNFSEQAENEI